MYEPNAKASTRKVHLEYNAVEFDVYFREIILDDEDKTEKKAVKTGRPLHFRSQRSIFQLV